MIFVVKSPNTYSWTKSNLSFLQLLKKFVPSTRLNLSRFIKMQKLCRYNFSSIENFSSWITEIFLKPFLEFSEKGLFIILFSSPFFHSRYFTSRVFHQCSSEFRNNQTAHWRDITGKNYTSAEFFGPRYA